MGFRPDVDIPRTSSNPGEKSAGELGYGSVLGFSQVDSAQSRCGAVELGLRRVNCLPGEIGAKECDYIMPALLAGSSDLECLPYQGKDCIKDFSAGGTLSPSVSDLSGPRGPYVTDGPLVILGRCPRRPSCSCYAFRWSLRRNLWRAVTQPCPGGGLGDVMS